MTVQKRGDQTLSDFEKVRLIETTAQRNRHGDCPTGVDHFVDEYMRGFGLEVLSHPAEWTRYGRSAGPIRNGVMVRQDGVVALAAWPGGSGTAMGKS
jgi:hypothetical protein